MRRRAAIEINGGGPNGGFQKDKSGGGGEAEEGISVSGDWHLRIWQRAARFFDGTPRPLDQGPLVFVNSTVRHPVARFLLWCRDFWLHHWQWLIGTAVAIILALIVRH